MRGLVAALAIVASSHALAQTASENSRANSECAASYSLDRRTGQTAPSDCSQVLRKAGQINIQVSGGVVAPEERTTVAIRFRAHDQEMHICTGVLLDEFHVLTAGHCGCGFDYEVTLDQVAFKASQGGSSVKISGSPILFDSLTCLRGPKPGSDLALLRLEKRLRPKTENGANIDTSDLGYPVFVTAADFLKALKPQSNLTVVGFGETGTGTIATRMKASVPVLTKDCFARPYRLACAPFLEMILADGPGRSIPRDTCGGDSGGPVFETMPVSLPQCINEVLPDVKEEDRQRFDYSRESNIRVPQPQNVLVAITSRAAPFAQPLRNGHCGGGGIYTLIGRKSVYAWFDANKVKPQRCVKEVVK